MKFRMMSDLHLEFENTKKELFPIPYIGEDYLILAGDIQVGTKKQKWFKRLLKYRNVVYILGNHEFYGHDIHLLPKAMKYFAKSINETAKRRCYPGRLHFLHDEVLQIPNSNIRILGSTLWSQIAPQFTSQVLNTMNDYKDIQCQARKINTHDTVTLHNKAVDFLSKELQNISKAEKILVMTHHAPHYESIIDKYRLDMVESAYASNLEYLLSNVDIWIHGHTHSSVDYIIGKCRIISNPRGYYGYSVNNDFNKDLIIKL